MFQALNDIFTAIKQNLGLKTSSDSNLETSRKPVLFSFIFGVLFPHSSLINKTGLKLDSGSQDRHVPLQFKKL